MMYRRSYLRWTCVQSLGRMWDLRQHQQQIQKNQIQTLNISMSFYSVLVWSTLHRFNFEFFRIDIKLLWFGQETIAFGSVATQSEHWTCGRTASQYNNLSINWKLEKKKMHSRVSCCCTQRTESTSFRSTYFCSKRNKGNQSGCIPSELRARSATAISTHSLLLLLLFIHWRSRWAAVWQRKITIFNLHICEQRQQ